MTNTVRVDGTTIHLGQAEFVLPPLPLVHMPKVKKLLQGGNFMEDQEYTEALGRAIYYSLRRNYPELTEEMVTESIDMTNYRPLVQSFMEVNQLRQAEGGAQGEA